MTTKVTIGGTVYAVPPIPFFNLEAAAEHLDRATTFVAEANADPETPRLAPLIRASRELIHVVALGLNDPAIPADYLLARVSSAESKQLIGLAGDLVNDAFDPGGAGEPEAAAAAAPPAAP